MSGERIVVPDDRSVFGVKVVELPDQGGARTIEPSAAGTDLPRIRPDNVESLLSLLTLIADPVAADERLRALAAAQATLDEREAAVAKAATEFASQVEATRKDLAAEIERQEQRLAEAAPQDLRDLRASVGELTSRLVSMLGRNFGDRLPAEDSGLSPLQRARCFFALGPGPSEVVKLATATVRVPHDPKQGWGHERLRDDTSITRMPYSETRMPYPELGTPPPLAAEKGEPPVTPSRIRRTTAQRRADRRAAERPRPTA